MQLPRHTLSSQIVAPAFVSATFTPSYAGLTPDASSSASSSSSYAPTSASSSYGAAHSSGLGSDSTPPKSHLFACATRSGFLVAQTCPLKVVASKSFPASQGGLAIAATIDDTSLVVLVGGGRVPRFAPNKVVIWDENAPVTSDRKRGGPEEVDTAEEEEAEGGVDSRSVAASTVFDAGSTFGGGETRGPLSGSSAENNVEAGLDELGLRTRSASSAPEKPGREATSQSSRGLPMQESRLGLAGLDSSLLREGTKTSDLGHESLASSSTSLTNSMMGSISATTEGLDDPFAFPADESKARRTPSPPTVEQRAASPSPLSDTSPGPTSPGPSSRSDRPQIKPEKRRQASGTTRVTGRDVMELEFGEAVQSVIVRSFELPLTAKSRDEPLADRGRRTFKMALLVVVLKTKAVVFELGEHIPMAQQKPSRDDGVNRPSPWGILYRTSIGILDDGRGLVDLVGLPGKRSALLTLSGRQPGHVQLVILSLLSPKQAVSTTTPGPPTSSSGVLASSIIAAHSASLVSLALSACGSLLATASKKGTLVRVWSTTGTAVAAGKPRTTIKAVLQMELRRGTEQAVILSMAFAPDRSVLAAASDKGTIHFFNLGSEAVGGKTLPHGRSGSNEAHSSRSSPGAAIPSSPGGVSGSGFGLSNSAAKYLPSGINQLASQIPSSLLPSYLKSTWSTAQFRIKLRTFAAYSSEERATRKSSARKGKGRAPPPAPPAARSGMGGDSAGGAGAATGGETFYYDDDVPAGGAGASRSTEGAWATLKGRIEDIRRWEPALDERVFLSWVWVPDPLQPEPKPGLAGRQQSTRAGAGTHKGRERATGSGGPAQPSPSPSPSPLPPPAAVPRGQYQLIALTTSGGWYRISLQDQGQAGGSSSSSAGDSGSGGDTVLNMYKQSSSSSSSSATARSKGGVSPFPSSAAAAAEAGGTGTGTGKEGTTLEEYRTFGSREEQWDTRGGWGE